MLEVRVYNAAGATEGLLDYAVFGVPAGSRRKVELTGPIQDSEGSETGPWEGHEAHSTYIGRFVFDKLCIPGLGCTPFGVDSDASKLKSVEVRVDGRLHMTAEYDSLHPGFAVSARNVGLRFFGNRHDNEVSGHSGNDRIFGYDGDDRLHGYTGNDRLVGGNGHDLLDGNKGNDRLVGGSGRDHLRGGAGSDWLRPGTGKDLLDGGVGADLFVFGSIEEAGRGSGRDVISRFVTGLDKLDLHLIDADVTRAGNQAFRFVDRTDFTGKAGQLVFAEGIVAGDVNGDGKADMQIEIVNPISLAAGDFLL